MVVSTPPSIIQGEVFEVKVLLFNYIETGPEELQVSSMWCTCRAKSFSAAELINLLKLLCLVCFLQHFS